MGIPVGPGRGSAAGSIVAYCLGITDVCPLEYNLLFERFLNPGRVSMPDIDIDFCGNRREEVIQYVRDKYGADCVCQIITFGTMASRGVLKDVGRVLDFPVGDINDICKNPQGPARRSRTRSRPTRTCRRSATAARSTSGCSSAGWGSARHAQSTPLRRRHRGQASARIRAARQERRRRDQWQMTSPGRSASSRWTSGKTRHPRRRGAPGEGGPQRRPRPQPPVARRPADLRVDGAR